MIRQTLRDFNSERGDGLAAYLAPTIGRWSAIYPKFSPEFDRFAKRLSLATGGVVLSLCSADEDDFLCNVCEAGKDYSHFRVTVGRHRKGKPRDAVIAKLKVLHAHADADARAALVERLCDLRQVTFASEVLVDFCKTFGVANALCSYEYIERGDYAGALDEIVELELAKC